MRRTPLGIRFGCFLFRIATVFVVANGGCQTHVAPNPLPPKTTREFPDDWFLETARDAHAQLEGKPMPPLKISGWVNGVVSADNMKGKAVLIDFYSSWCGPCKKAVPHINTVMDTYAARGVLVVGVCTSNEKQELMEQVVRDQNIRFPTARDPQLAAHDAWRISYYPTYAVVDRHGTVRAIGLWGERLEQVLDRILSEDVHAAK